MAKSTNQKLKLMYLRDILLEKTDEEHSITMPEILSSLQAYGITAERKSIYDDLECLRQFGMDIIGEKRGKTFYYSVGRRDFELAELKLLVDSVQSAKFITEKKSQELIQKIESLASHHDALKLQRQVYVRERVKTLNEGIYYNVDRIHTSIANDEQIRFQYFNWNIKKEMELKKDGAYYEVSPWALSWDDENYYLVAYDSEAKKIKHFRVDKMLHIASSEKKREGKTQFQKFDVAEYSKKIFGMFAGEEKNVKLECRNEMAGVIIDRFGQEVAIRKVDDEHFTVHVKVAVSRQFIAWVMSLGRDVRIVGPDDVVEQVKEEVWRLQNQYLNN